jgi:hypothetical protein
MKVLKELLAIHEAAKVDDEAIFTKVQDAVGSMFDGGDPIDQLIPWMKKTGVTMDDIDNAVKKNVGRGKKKYGMNDWLTHGQTWLLIKFMMPKMGMLMLIIDFIWYQKMAQLHRTKTLGNNKANFN